MRNHIYGKAVFKFCKIVFACSRGSRVLVCEGACRVHCPPSIPALFPRCWSDMFGTAAYALLSLFFLSVPGCVPTSRQGKSFSWELCCHWPAINQLLDHVCLADTHSCGLLWLQAQWARIWWPGIHPLTDLLFWCVQQLISKVHTYLKQIIL